MKQTNKQTNNTSERQVRNKYQAEYIKVIVLVLIYVPPKKNWYCSTKLKSSTGTGNGTAKLGKYWYLSTTPLVLMQL
jgi:hypothetical protein